MSKKITFYEQIEEKLTGLGQKEKVFFAWLCAVRALPFLGANGNFSFWITDKGDERQKYLFSVFRALDAAAANAANVAIDAVKAASDASISIARIKPWFFASNRYNNYYAAATNNSAFAAYAAAGAAAADPNVDVGTADAANSAAEAADIYWGDIRPMIEEDINRILAGQTDGFRLVDYGSVWDRFQTALEEVGCAYWGELYAALFAKGFVMDGADKTALKRRLEVPKEIQMQGAAAVVQWLEPHTVE